MSIEICQLCQGRGKVIGMGTIVKDCEECKGIGKIEVVAANHANPDSTTESIAIPIPKKKPGRPFAKKLIEG
jgi:DnaJ-class molecular chaperone